MDRDADTFQVNFAEFKFKHGKIAHSVWHAGNGAPVILMHELDGFSPAFMRLAERLAEIFHVHAPVFYGDVGETVGPIRSVICMRREFEAFRLGRSSPIVDWVRGLVGHVQPGGDEERGVGVIGMCMSGGIVLGTISHPAVSAGVAAQPSLPLAPRGWGSKRRREDFGMEPSKIAEASASGTPVLTLRYGNDRVCPRERIPSIARQIPSVVAPPAFLANCGSHATLTDRYREDSNATVQELSERAIKETIDFLSTHLN